MAGSILDEEEVQTLLEGLETGGLTGGEGGNLYKGEDEVTPYRFSQAEEEESPELPAFEVVAQRLERFFSDSMVGEFPVLRPAIASRGYDLERFGMIAEEASDPGVFAVLTTKDGNLLITVELAVARAMVAAILGEEEIDAEALQEMRGELTRIEQRLFKRVIWTMAQDLTRAWEPLYVLHKITDVRIESYIRDTSIARRDVRVFRSNFNFTIGDYESPMLLIYPMPLLEPHMDLLRGEFLAGGAEVDEEWREEFQQQLMKVDATMSAVLGHTTITLRELLSLEPGDFFYLDRGPGDPVDVYDGGGLRWKAEAGKVEGKIAARLLHDVREGQEDGESE